MLEQQIPGLLCEPQKDPRFRCLGLGFVFFGDGKSPSKHHHLGEYVFNFFFQASNKQIQVVCLFSFLSVLLFNYWYINWWFGFLGSACVKRIGGVVGDTPIRLLTPPIYHTWNPKQPFINGCFNWMIPNLYIGNGCLTKQPF